MFHRPTLTTTVTVQWECNKRPGVERQCDVVVEYTFDGVDDVDVLAADIVRTDVFDGDDAPYGISEQDFDALVDEAVAERAHDAYADWLSGQAEQSYWDA